MARPTGPFWFHEIKHDGYRLMVHRDGWGDGFPGIVVAGRRLKAESFVIDGEVSCVARGRKLRLQRPPRQAPQRGPPQIIEDKHANSISVGGAVWQPLDVPRKHSKMKLLTSALSLAFVMSVNSAAWAETLGWSCSYSTLATPTGLKKDNFKLEFAMDTLTKRAVLIGNAGMADLDFYNGDQGITFQEKLGSGAIQTTTISHQDGKSVHSRHSMLGGVIVPSQYYGDCK